MTRYKPKGLFMKQRTIRRWILTVDGEQLPFKSKRLAFISGRAAIASGLDTRLHEENILRTRHDGRIEDDSFRIDITYQLERDHPQDP